MSNKKIKTEPLVHLGKRRNEFIQTQENQVSNKEQIYEIKRIKNGYYCYVHSEKEICEIYLCSGNNAIHINSENTTRTYLN